jgi:hypothetical protein
LIILIDLVGWGEPKYNEFYPSPGKCHATTYTTLWHTSDAKQRKENSSIFSMYYDEMQENIANTWRILPEVVRKNQGIADFKASRHNMWIKEKRDPMKEWLQLRYCVTAEEVQWAMKDLS